MQQLGAPQPPKVAAEVLAWVGRGDPERAAQVVQPGLRTAEPEARATDAELAEGLDAWHLEVFDELYATIDADRPLTESFVQELNRTDEELRPVVLEHRARVDAGTIADILGHE